MRAGRASAVGRLRKRADFLAAASGRRFHTTRMTVQGRLRGDDALGLRFGLTVTRKVGHATERNRIKRRLREAIRSAAEGHAQADADVVVIGRRDILTADFRLLIEDLRRALRTVTKPKSVRPSEFSPLAEGEHRGTPHA